MTSSTSSPSPGGETVSELFPGHRTTCYQCAGKWGECTCPSPDPEDENGFTFEDFYITDPLVSECRRFFVDPVVYYGQAYLEWAEKQGLVTLLPRKE